MVYLIYLILLLSYGVIFYIFLNYIDRKQARINGKKPLQSKILLLHTVLLIILFLFISTRESVCCTYVQQLIIVGLFYIAGIIDWQHRIIPNSVILLILILTISNFIYTKNIIIDRIVFSFIILSLLIIIRVLFSLTKNIYVIGFGDIKLLFVIALNSDYFVTLIVLWSAALLGILYSVIQNNFSLRKSLTTLIPFGSFLSITFILFYLIGISNETIVKYYERMYGY